MELNEKTIKEILLKEDYLTAEDFEKAEKFAATHKISPLQYLISEGLLTKDLVGQAVAESLGASYADINSRPPGREQVLLIPEAIARKWRLVVFEEQKDSIVLATDTIEGNADQLLSELKEVFPEKAIEFRYALSEDIDSLFVHYRKSLETRFSKIIEKQTRIAPELLEEIIEDALLFRASDIHFEPQSKSFDVNKGGDVVVRFRIDGVLHEAGRIKREYYDNVLNRIKVLARLRIDEHFAAQDGSIRYRGKHHMIDLRISVIPTLDGEKVAIRVLAEYVQGFQLADLGISARHQEMLSRSSKKPFGMVLIAGPTGSGKTTTLYAVLKLLNQPDVNITTIEDPVEYKIAGVNQIQVNQATNLTFAKGLRSIVRQDPDIILVGEIRDQETAEIAVNAALTGHRLFSTFHANDAATTVPRLLDMGIEPFLLASTLELVVAQRLLRKICDSCKYSRAIPKAELQKKLGPAKAYFSGKSATLYEGKGCEACGNTGYWGRTAIVEIIEKTPELEKLILDSPSSQEIWSLSQKQGSLSMFEDGISKVKSGITTLEELLRVAPIAHAKAE